MNLFEYLKDSHNLTSQLPLTLMCLAVYLLITNLSARLIKRYGKKKKLSISRVKYTTKYFHFIFFLIFLIAIGLIWDLSFKGLSVYFISFFTVAGVALFASWSMLSNITSAIIMFFFFPYRIGSKIRILDGDNSVEGIIYDISLFSILIRDDKGRDITFPNNLAFQKTIVIIEH